MSKEIARQALEILDREGWVKGALQDEDGRHCIGGAWNLACHGHYKWDFEHTEKYRLLADMIRAQFPEARKIFSCEKTVMVYSAGNWILARREVVDLFSFIATWNNAEQTTFDDVRMVLEKVAAG